MSDRSYTKEQEIIVERILKNKAHEYYKILDIEKTASEGEVKKAYRKISLKVHPDKNGHPKSDESFKRVAKAFEVLGDASKRRIYDQTGSDPDSRGGFDSSSASTSGFNAAHAGAHPFFQAGGPFAFGGAPPQGFNGFQFQQGGDLFDILFGGNGGSPFGGTTFTFGGPGVGGSPFGGFQQFPQRPRHAGRNGAGTQQHQAQQNAQNQSFYDTFKQYLPLILMLLIPMISNWFSDSADDFQFHKKSPYVFQKTSQTYSIPYYITEKQSKTLNDYKLRKIDKEVEMSYVSTVRDNCRRESRYKEHQIQDAYGWFFTDEEQLNKAQNIKLPNCERLSQMGLNLL